MRGVLFVAIWLGLAGASHAQNQPCFSAPASWSTAYQQGSIQSTTYYTQTLVLTVLFRTNINYIYVNVPLSTAQGLTSITNADSYYSARISGKFPTTMVEEEQFGCPLLNEDGALLLQG